MAKILTPAPLREGDKIAILSPAGIVKPDNVYKALPVLRNKGWEPYVCPSTFHRHGTYAGTDDERYADLEAALTDPETRAILCSRGGYGVVHLMERLAKLPLRNDPKWVIGFSDISALHALMASAGIESIHAHMTSHLAATGGHDDDSLALFDILEGHNVSYEIDAHHLNREGKASGRLLGGNLAVISDLIGTPFNMLQPGTILFMEDVSEPIYKIERIMYQLRLSGVMAKLKGMIVGRFTDYSKDVDNASMETMISRIVEPFGFPVAYHAPIGHVSHNIPLVESRMTTLTVAPGIVRIDQ